MAYPYISSYAALDPNAAASYREVSTSYYFPASRLGAATSIQTSNQIAEVDARLKEGMNVVELSTISPEIFETMPKQQFKEIGQLAKLANADVTLHAPTIDPAGFTKQGWSEFSRSQAENQLLDAVQKAHDLNPQGNVPVTIHASAIPAAEWKKEKGIDGKAVETKEMMVVVNPENGEISPMRREMMYYPGKYPGATKEGKVISTPEEMLDMANASQWRNTIMGVQEMKRHRDEMLTNVFSQVGIQGEVRPTEEDFKQKEAGLKRSDFATVEFYNTDIELKLRSIYDNAYKHGKDNEEVIKQLVEIRKKWIAEKEAEGKAKSEGQLQLMRQNFYGDMLGRFNNLGHVEDKKTGEIVCPIKTLLPVEDFAKEHAAKTIGNVALRAYNQFGDTAPIVSVENFMPNMAFSRGEQLAGLIKESRKQFVNAAVASGKMKEGEATKQAEKLIGATWDVGHINLLRKYGFEEKDIIAETKKVAKYVKHAHIADNFGFEETHLPPGMGNVPVKEMMKEMEKAGFSGKAIVEAGNFVAQFKTSPHAYALENLNAPIYGAQGPTWGEARGLYGGGMGYGVQFPEQHFAMYGAGFSSLPSSLGGQMPGKQSRFSGAPME